MRGITKMVPQNARNMGIVTPVTASEPGSRRRSSSAIAETASSSREAAQ